MMDKYIAIIVIIIVILLITIIILIYYTFKFIASWTMSYSESNELAFWTMSGSENNELAFWTAHIIWWDLSFHNNIVTWLWTPLSNLYKVGCVVIPYTQPTHAYIDPLGGLYTYLWAWLVGLAFANGLSDATKGKGPHKIMANINVVRYATLLIVKEKYYNDSFSRFREIGLQQKDENKNK